MKIHTYEVEGLWDDPRFQRFTASYPGWTFQFIELPGGGEEFCWYRRLIQIDPRTPDIERALAHAVAHLRLHRKHGLLGLIFSPEQEAEADWLADAWLSWTADGTISSIGDVA